MLLYTLANFLHTPTPTTDRLRTCCRPPADLNELSGLLANRVEKVPFERSPLLHRLYNLSAAAARRRARAAGSGGGEREGRGEDGEEEEEEGDDDDDDDEDEGEGEGDEAVIDERCPQCNHPQLSFRTAQLRGIDEGQTIFYTCLNAKCRHSFTVHS